MIIKKNQCTHVLRIIEKKNHEVILIIILFYLFRVYNINSYLVLLLK